jgi:hypothetical protein
VEGQQSDQIHNLKPPIRLDRQVLARENWCSTTMKVMTTNLGTRARLTNPQSVPCPEKSWLAAQCQRLEHLPGIRPLGMISLRYAFLIKMILNTERTLCRKPSDIDPTGKDPDPAVTEPNLSKDPEPTAENQPTAESQPTTDSQPTGAHASDDKANPSDLPPTGTQSATTETASTQEPPTGNQSDVGPDQEIPEVEAQTTTSQGPEAGNDSVVGSPDKEQGSTHAQPGTSSGNSSSQVMPL